MLKVKCLVLLSMAFIVAACAPSPTMTPDEYEQITDEFTEEAALYVFENEDVEVDAEFRDYAEGKLEEVAQRYNFTAQNYLEAAEEINEDWNTLYQRIEDRVIQMEVQERLDDDPEIGTDPEREIDPDELPVEPELEI